MSKERAGVDLRRETLVVETRTRWPADSPIPDDERRSIADWLHRHPERAASVSYVRCPTGFVRQIDVTEDDVRAARSL